MSTVNSMKCACDSCLCIVSLTDAVQKEGKYYCDEACANHHADGEGCHHQGCSCG